MNDPEKAALERTAQAGIAALQHGDGQVARRAFETIVASGRATVQIWLWLAQACDLLDDRAAVMAHVARVVSSPRTPPCCSRWSCWESRAEAQTVAGLNTRIRATMSSRD